MRRIPGLRCGGDSVHGDGTLDLKALRRCDHADDVAAVVVQSPNFFGVIEHVRVAGGDRACGWSAAGGGDCRGRFAGSGAAARGSGHRGDGRRKVSDWPPSYGGPYAGVIATREKFVRQMPGRLAGQTTDSEGQRGFVLTLATREQHIRREKATSNICTNQALCALAATVHLALLGKEGLREMAEQNLAKAQFALSELEKIPGVKRALLGAVFQRIYGRIAASR